jgi:hypothetical protein
MLIRLSNIGQREVIDEFFLDFLDLGELARKVVEVGFDHEFLGRVSEVFQLRELLPSLHPLINTRIRLFELIRININPKNKIPREINHFFDSLVRSLVEALDLKQRQIEPPRRLPQIRLQQLLLKLKQPQRLIIVHNLLLVVQVVHERLRHQREPLKGRVQVPVVPDVAFGQEVPEQALLCGDHVEVRPARLQQKRALCVDLCVVVHDLVNLRVAPENHNLDVRTVVFDSINKERLELDLA